MFHNRRLWCCLTIDDRNFISVFINKSIFVNKTTSAQDNECKENYFYPLSQSSLSQASNMEKVRLCCPYHFTPTELKRNLEQLAHRLQSPYMSCHQSFTKAVSIFSGNSCCMTGSDFKIPDLTKSNSRPQKVFKLMSLSLFEEMERDIGRHLGNEGLIKSINDNISKHKNYIFLYATIDELGACRAYHKMFGCQASIFFSAAGPQSIPPCRFKRSGIRLAELVQWFRNILRDIMFNNLVPHLIANPSVCTNITFVITPSHEAACGQIKIDQIEIEDIKMACVRSNPPFEKAASVLCKFNEIMI